MEIQQITAQTSLHCNRVLIHMQFTKSRCWSARVPGLFTYCSFKAAGVSIKMFFFTLQIMILFFLTLLLFLTFPDVISHSEMIKTLLPPCCLLDIIHAFLQPLEDLHEGEIFITEIYAKS